MSRSRNPRPPEAPQSPTSRGEVDSLRALADVRDWPLVAALVALASALGVGSLVLRPDRALGSAGLLFGDQGYNLWVAERLLDGDRLYAEIGYQYGSLPAYLHAAMAALFGNGVSTFNAFFLVVTLVNVALATLLVRSVASRLTTAVVVGLGLSASLLVPGSLLGGTTNAFYVPVERTLVLLGALLWTTPWTRRPSRAVVLGCVIGSWQAVRFGGGVFLGIALVATDLLALYWARRLDRDSLAGWLRSTLVTAGVAAGIAIALILVALATLPADVARDVVWPGYVLESYRGWVNAEVRWPRWGGWAVLIGQYLSPLVGAALGLAAIGRYLARGTGSSSPDPSDSRDGASIRLLLPLLFYLLASVGLFRMVYHFLMFAWALVIPAAWVFERSGRAGRLAIAALLLPCFAVNARSIFLTRPEPGQHPLRTSRGDVLWGEPATEAAAVAARLRDAKAEGRADGAMVLPVAAGFHHFYQVHTPLRQAWFLPGLVRPYDEAEIVRSLDEIGTIVVRDPSPEMRVEDPCTWRSPSPFDPSTCAAIARRIASHERVGRFVLVALR